MSEFTGERVVPGEVNVDLWNEHLARYAFAARLVEGATVLDVGCGTGYGSAELAQRAHSVTAIDVSDEAVEYASQHYRLTNLRFERASAAALPFSDQSFTAVVAFEVIEHLADWELLLREARRVLTADGVFLVSTPNRLYYQESRKGSGANPYHVHEFEFDEFHEAVARYFPGVRVCTQDRVEATVFCPPRVQSPAAIKIELADTQPKRSAFFLAVSAPGRDLAPFVFVPRTANILREREQHIARLEGELALKNEWLEKATAERDALQQLRDADQKHIEEKSRWGLQLEREWNQSLARIAALQAELESEQESARQVAQAYEAKVRELERDVQDKVAWARETEQRLEGELQAKITELGEAVRLLDQAEETVRSRTEWAQSLQTTIDLLQQQLAAVRTSRWVKLGRLIGIGPRIDRVG
jgi:SAM-dependent methyltransferase